MEELRVKKVWEEFGNIELDDLYYNVELSKKEGGS